MPSLSKSVLNRIPVPDGLENTVDSTLDRVVRGQSGAVVEYVQRWRRKHPHGTPAELIDHLDTRYRVAVGGIGAASGGAAAIPGVGTVASIATGLAEIAAFVEATALYTMAVAEAYALPLHDDDQRRALVIAVLLGKLPKRGDKQGDALRAAGWTAELRGGLPERGKLGGYIGRHLIARFGVRQGALVAGRALPLGIGAGIGVVGNLGLARASIRTAQRLFGPPPPRFEDTLTVERG